MAIINNSDLIDHFISTFDLKHRISVSGSSTQLQIDQIVAEREKQIISLENQILNNILKTESNILQITQQGVYLKLPNSEKKIPRYSPYKSYEPNLIDLILFFKVDSDEIKNELIKYSKWQYVEIVGKIVSLHKEPTHYNFDEKDDFRDYISVTLDLISIKLKSHPKNEGCFIATTVYGDYNSPEVIILRSFRDKYLKVNFFGRQFVHLYYITSPIISRKIANSKICITLIRYIILSPIIKVTQLLLGKN